ncbi:MAG: hypothetical protein ACRDH7_17515 [Actinomycetota bacterium]
MSLIRSRLAHRSKIFRAISLSVAIGVFPFLASCGLGSNDPPAATVYDETPFDPQNFVDPLVATNRWFPLTPGTQLITQGTTLIGNRKVPYEVIKTVTDVTRVIDGVKTLLVYDYETGVGQVTQRSIDYFAQDVRGNLWIMGGATEAWEAGRYVEVDEVWMSGVDEAKAGIWMPADPTASTTPWIIDHQPDQVSVARFVRTQAMCVPFGCFPHVLVTFEGTKSGPNNELKYYALGLGQIRNEPRADSRHDDTELLINAIQLSHQGLAAASGDALQIDRRAARAYPRFYGTVEARRAP